MGRSLPAGIFPTPRGFRAFQWIPAPGYPTGRLASKRFPADTSIEEMEGWRLSQRITARQQQLGKQIEGQARTGAGFLADADRYLEVVRAMPSWAERRRELRAWALILGEQDTLTITPTQIRAARDQWLTIGPRRVQKRQPDGRMAWIDTPRPLAPQSVNLRLRALENLWTVLDGRHAPNPVRDVPEAPEPVIAPRAIPYSLITKVLAQLQSSATKARLLVIAYVGLSHAQLMLVESEDVNLAAQTLYLRPRRKGQRTTRGVTIPLTSKGVQAFRQMQRFDAWGAFSPSFMRKAFKRACATLKLQADLTPYDLRHSFATLAYQRSGDLHATGVLLGHRDPRTTTRYTLGAVDPRLSAAVQALQPTRKRRGVKRGVKRDRKPQRVFRSGSRSKRKIP